MEKHAPSRKKFIRGSHTPFMNKELRKAIFTRSGLQDKFYKAHGKRTRFFIKKTTEKMRIFEE